MTKQEAFLDGLEWASGTAHETARGKGFWRGYDATYGMSGEETADLRFAYISQKLCLLHSEVSEALEALRRGDKAGVIEELADVVIRTLDLAHVVAGRPETLGMTVLAKMDKNVGRPAMHGKRF